MLWSGRHNDDAGVRRPEVGRCSLSGSQDGGAGEAGFRSEVSETAEGSMIVGAVCILAGGLRRSPLVEAAGTSVLDIDLGGGCTVLEAQLRILRESGVDTSAPVLIAAGGHVPQPKTLGHVAGFEVRQGVDDGLRGPAGVVRDMAAAFATEAAQVLVLEANRFQVSGMIDLCEEHAMHHPAATVAAAEEDEPAGATLLTGRCLSLVPPRGFMDLKEQLLSRVYEQGERIRACRVPDGASLPVRTLAELLVLRDRLRSVGADWFAGSAEDRTQEVVVTQSIIGAGAVLGPGSVVARSLVMPGAVVQAGEVLADTVRRGAGAEASKMSASRRGLSW